MRIRQAARGEDDGFRHSLIPGVRGSADAERLAEELAFASGRLLALATAPPGPYAEVASEPDLEEATWLAFLIAYLSPLEGDRPFDGIEGARTSWASGRLPRLQDVPTGPRTAHDPRRGGTGPAAYRAWAARSGTQQRAFRGEEHWTPGRRFERAFERLALPGLHRAARFDLLAMLGRTGRYDVGAGSLFLRGSDDETAVGAKRVFGIGDPQLLDRRALDLAEACDIPLEAFDLGLYNWQRGESRAMLGANPEVLDLTARDGMIAALGL